MVKTALKNSTKRKQNDKLYNFFFGHYIKLHLLADQ